MQIKKSDRKWFLTKVKKTCSEYNLIKDGDKIAVGVSGGKDSSALLYLMNALQRELPIHFQIQPIFLDLGWEMDVSPLERYCKSLGYRLHIEKTHIKKIVFEIRKEKNPCSLCANLRRGALNDTAKKLGYDKVALGHHLDDVIETFFMNLLYTGRLATFQPKVFLDRKEITVIRPLVSLEEKTVASITKNKGLPVLESPCPLDKKTKREEIKKLISGICNEYPDFRLKFLTGLKGFTPDNLWQRD